MKERFSSEDIAGLMSAAHYRAFIKTALDTRAKNRKRRFGYADLARAAGFASRSFPRDVVVGKKRLTLSSLYPMMNGLGLTGELADYFRLLVELEHADCRTKPLTNEKTLRALTNLRDRLKQKQSVSVNGGVFKIKILPKIYAALGSATQGATLKQIQNRTKLTQKDIGPTLQSLLEFKLIQQQGDRFFALTNHVNLAGLKQSEIYKEFFLHAMEEAMSSASIKFDTDEALFFSSSFSVDAALVPKVKSELRSLLLKYVDTHEEAEGDKIVSIACSLI